MEKINQMIMLKKELGNFGKVKVRNCAVLLKPLSVLRGVSFGVFWIVRTMF